MKQRVLLAVLTAMLFYSCGTALHVEEEAGTINLFDYLDKKQ